jgi:hypothetical protein
VPVLKEYAVKYGVNDKNGITGEKRNLYHG